MVQRSSRLIGGVYQVGQVIASQPFLTTYTAYNRNTNDVVGLQVIDLPPTCNPQSIEQLLTPLARRRTIQSAHVLRLYDWGIFEGKIYIATDPPRGITLRQLTDTEHVSLARSLDLAIQMTHGVAALQASGIVDIDLRPQLITIDSIIGQRDRVQIDDMGLRRLLRQLGYVQGQQTQSIEYLDTRYMPPENIYQGIIGSSSDVYQLGILLFELVTGRVPFVGRTAAETGIMQSSNPVPRMAQFQNETPPGLQEIVDRAMAKYPLQRYPHAAAMLGALEALPSLERKTTAGRLATVRRAGTPPGKSADLTSDMLATSTSAIEAIDTIIADRPASLNLSAESPLPDNDRIYAYLDVEQANGETERLPIRDPQVIIGRTDPRRGITPEIDLTNLDPQTTVSRQHARLRFEKTFFYMEDLKSRNKTRLRELVLIPFKAELLEHGDTINFGSVKVIFRIPGKRDAPVPPDLP